jgi:hypothetical protein
MRSMVVIAVTWVGMATILPAIACSVWNSVLPTAYGWPRLTYPAAMALFTLTMIAGCALGWANALFSRED